MLLLCVCVREEEAAGAARGCAQVGQAANVPNVSLEPNPKSRVLETSISHHNISDNLIMQTQLEKAPERGRDE